jgi:hypothetical protein
MTPRVISVTLLMFSLISGAASLRAQSKRSTGGVTAPEGYDYKSLAIDSILVCGREAAKLPDMEQRIPLMVKAAELLPASNRVDAIRLLETALSDLGEWGSSEKSSSFRRFRSAQLRDSALAAYAKLDSEKAQVVGKRYLPEPKSDSETHKPLKGSNWFQEQSSNREGPDQISKIALSILDSEPERASVLAIKSVQTGIVTLGLLSIVDRLKQGGRRSFLNKMEEEIGRTLAGSATQDPSSLAFAASLIQTDTEMPLVARAGLIQFTMNSVQSWVDLIISESKNGGVDPSYISIGFVQIGLSVKPAMAKYSPEDAVMLDLLLEKVSTFVPEKMKSMMMPPETISNLADRLVDILREQNPERRDRRLRRLILDALRAGEPEGTQPNLEVASDAVMHIGDERLKNALADLIIVAKVNSLAKGGSIVDAERLASSISSKETRAWALLALSAIIAKQDQFLQLQLINNGMKAVDTASPTPRRVELAFMGAGMMVSREPERAFELLSTCAKYANSISSGLEGMSNEISKTIHYESSIGNLRAMLTRDPQGLNEIEIDNSFAVLGRSDWFRSQQLTDQFNDLALRLKLKLLFAGAVISAKPKPDVEGKHLSPNGSLPTPRFSWSRV